MTFLTIEEVDGVAILEVQCCYGIKHFPLTKLGCIKAGAYLKSIGCDSWMYSSSLDFPREYKKSFKYNVNELILEGHKNEN